MLGFFCRSFPSFFQEQNLPEKLQKSCGGGVEPEENKPNNSNFFSWLCKKKSLGCNYCHAAELRRCRDLNLSWHCTRAPASPSFNPVSQAGMSLNPLVNCFKKRLLSTKSSPAARVRYQTVANFMKENPEVPNSISPCSASVTQSPGVFIPLMVLARSGTAITFPTNTI